MASGPFFTRRIGTKKDNNLATALMIDRFDQLGETKLIKDPAVINVFSGTAHGKPEADRLADRLNEAWERFHKC